MFHVAKTLFRDIILYYSIVEPYTEYSISYEYFGVDTHLDTQIETAISVESLNDAAATAH